MHGIAAYPVLRSSWDVAVDTTKRRKQMSVTTTGVKDRERADCLDGGFGIVANILNDRYSKLMHGSAICQVTKIVCHLIVRKFCNNKISLIVSFNIIFQSISISIIHFHS